MAAYNRINGEWAAQSHWLLTRVLRDEWGFDGVVVSDWGAVVDRVASVAAGLDLQMPGGDAAADGEVVDAVARGTLPAAAAAGAAARVAEVGPAQPPPHVVPGPRSTSTHITSWPARRLGAQLCCCATT